MVVDAANNKLKAIGKVDPWKLKEFLEAKTHKMVDIISPKDPPKKSKDDDKKKDEGQKKSSDDKKPKPVSNPSTDRVQSPFRHTNSFLLICLWNDR